MRSIRGKFILFASLIVAVVALGGMLNLYFLRQATDAESMILAISDAIESHLNATFYNEEVRVLAHSSLALYGFSDTERKNLEGSIKTYATGVNELAMSYAARSRAEVEKNLARGAVPESLKATMRQHLQALATYHKMVGTSLEKPASSKEAMIDTYGKLNAVRSTIGDLRKAVSQGLVNERTEATALSEWANTNQKSVLIGTFAGIIAIMVVFLSLLGREVSAFTHAITKGLDEVRAGRSASLSLGRKASVEMRLVERSFEELERQRLALNEMALKESEAAQDKNQRVRALENAVAEFERVMAEIVEGMNTSAIAMSHASEGLSLSTEQASNGVEALAYSSGMARDSVTAVAGSSTQMAQSITGLAAKLRDTFSIVTKANVLARQTDTNVEQLSSAALRIGEVVSLIQSIAEQTNLLALNATIEAARAGDSGRGFAVVASEVKNLASRTAQATDEIAAQIKSIQSTTTTSVEAIHAIVDTIGEAERYAQEMSSVVTQQDSAVQEVAHSAETARHHMQKLREDAEHVASRISSAKDTVGSVASASLTLNGAASRINQAVTDLLRRAAA
jgi:methyl-accepting chemotaxis protein